MNSESIKIKHFGIWRFSLSRSKSLWLLWAQIVLRNFVNMKNLCLEWDWPATRLLSSWRNLSVTYPIKWANIFSRGVFNIFVRGDKGDVLVGKYDNTGSFGELALMYNMPRAATIQVFFVVIMKCYSKEIFWQGFFIQHGIKAATDGFLWAMDRLTFRKIVLRSAFQKRKMYETLLQGVPFLNTLSVSISDFGSYFKIYDMKKTFLLSVLWTHESGWCPFAEILRWRRCNRETGGSGRRDVLHRGWKGYCFSHRKRWIRKNRKSRSSYINLGLTKFDIKMIYQVTTIEKGGYFGELALVQHKPRAATVVADEEVRCACKFTLNGFRWFWYCTSAQNLVYGSIHFRLDIGKS